MTEHRHFPTADSMRDAIRHGAGQFVVIYRCACGARITADGDQFVSITPNR